MKTIVTYSSTRRPVNDYPERIISPVSPGICCLTHMERIGSLEEEDGVPFAYKRCRSCGFTVRWFPEEVRWAGLGKAAGKPLVEISKDGMGRRRAPVTFSPRRKGRTGLLRPPVYRQDRQRDGERPRVAQKRVGSGTR